MLRNNGDRELGNSGWRLHFNFCREIEPSKPGDGVRFVHVNGDHFYLEPTADFLPFRRGTERAIRFATQLPLIKETDGPSGLFLVVKDPGRNEPEIIPLGEPKFGGITSKRQSLRSRDDLVAVPTAKSRYEENLRLAPIDPPNRSIVPTPISQVAGEGETQIRPQDLHSWSSGIKP